MKNSGYIDAAIYVVISAISFVFLNKLVQHIDPVIALFVMSGIGIITFNFLSITKIKATYVTCFKNKLLFLAMSAALGLDWVCMLYASYLADPFVSLAGLFIFLGIVGFSKLFLENKALTSLFSVVLLLISAITLFFSYKVNNSQHLGYGIILGAIAGMAFYVYIASSHRLSKIGNLSSMQILSTRFWVLFIGSAIFVPYTGILSIILHNLGSLILISYGSLIVPIYFNQQAIVKLGSALTSVFISFVPPVTYLSYALINQRFMLSNVIVCLIITIALVLPNLIGLLKFKRVKK